MQGRGAPSNGRGTVQGIRLACLRRGWLNHIPSKETNNQYQSVAQGFPVAQVFRRKMMPLLGFWDKVSFLGDGVKTARPCVKPDGPYPCDQTQKHPTEGL